ncbi:MAG: hypothetical protein AAFR61_07530 [Bacteroidota bacterium]
MNTRRISLLTLLSLFACVSCQSVSVGPNQVGVIFKKFGGGVDTTEYLLAGNHLIGNSDRLILYDYVDLEESFLYEVAGPDSQSYTVELDVLYQLLPEKASLIEKYLGEGYQYFLIGEPFEALCEEFTLDLPMAEITPAVWEPLKDDLLKAIAFRDKWQALEIDEVKIRLLSSDEE